MGEPIKLDGCMASKAVCAPVMLACRNDDGTLVCSFVEDP